MQRRHFLVLGAAGAATLAVAGWWTWIRRPGAPTAEQDAAAIVAAIVPAMLAGALPEAEAERKLAVAETVNNVGRAIAGLPPASRGELAQLFGLLALPAGRRFFAGVPVPWGEANVDQVGVFLDAWQASTWSLKRSAYDALHQLIIAAWYGNPRAWGPIGYPGPPALG